MKNRVEFLKTLGVIVLVLGFVSASLVFWLGQKRSTSLANSQQSSVVDGGWKDDTLSPGDLKGSSRTIEMNFGKVAVLAASWLHWWQQLEPHETLAITITTISTLTALSCFIIAKGWWMER